MKSALHRFETALTAIEASNLKEDYIAVANTLLMHVGTSSLRTSVETLLSTLARKYSAQPDLYADLESTTIALLDAISTGATCSGAAFTTTIHF